MTQIDPNSDPLASDAHVTSVDGAGAVDSKTMTVDEVNSLLGTTFTDKESALQSIKNTKNFVGKREQDIIADYIRTNGIPQRQAPADTVSKSEFKSLQDELFYTQNPQLKEYKDVIESMGSNPAEVVGSPAFKKVYAKVVVADAAEQSRSIVSSSPRLAAQKTVMNDAVAHANATGTSRDSLAEILAAGINDEMSAN